MRLLRTRPTPRQAQEVTRGAVNAEVVLAGGQEIVAVVTNSALETLGLAVGKPAYAGARLRAYSWPSIDGDARSAQLDQRWATMNRRGKENKQRPSLRAG